MQAYQLLELQWQSVEEIKRLGIYEGAKQRNMETIAKKLYEISGRSWNGDGLQLISDTEVDSLELIAEDISTRLNIKLADKSLIDNLVKSIATLTDQVLKSELEEEFKRDLVEGLEGLRRSCLVYRMRGNGAIRPAMDQVSGVVFRHWLITPENAKQPVVKGFFELLGQVDTVLNVGAHAQNLLPAVVEAFQRLVR
jgi:hypothetical protein